MLHETKTPEAYRKAVKAQTVALGGTIWTSIGKNNSAAAAISTARAVSALAESSDIPLYRRRCSCTGPCRCQLLDDGTQSLVRLTLKSLLLLVVSHEAITAPKVHEDAWSASPPGQDQQLLEVTRSRRNAIGVALHAVGSTAAGGKKLLQARRSRWQQALELPPPPQDSWNAIKSELVVWPGRWPLGALRQACHWYP